MIKSVDNHRMIILFFLMLSLSSYSYLTRGKGDFTSNVIEDKMDDQESENNGHYIVRGKVKTINRLNVDKSGHNPQFQIIIDLAPASVEESNLRADVNPLPRFLIREKTIIEQIGKLPYAGDNLIIESFSNEKAPRMLPIKKIEFQ